MFKIIIYDKTPIYLYLIVYIFVNNRLQSVSNYIYVCGLFIDLHSPYGPRCVLKPHWVFDQVQSSSSSSRELVESLTRFNDDSIGGRTIMSG